MLALLFGDVDAQTDQTAIGRAFFQNAQPPPVGQLLFNRLIRLEMARHAFGQPVLFAPDGVGILPLIQTKPQDFLKRFPGDHFGRAVGVDFLVPLVAHDQFVIVIIEDKSVRHGLNRGPHAHHIGDVQIHAHDVARGRAPINQLDVGPVPQADNAVWNLILGPAIDHPL